MDTTSCRLIVETNGFPIVEQEIDGIVLIERHPKREPALICSYNYRSIRLLIADRVTETVALREVAQKADYEFEMTDVKSWKAIAKERPELIVKAKEFENSPEFFMAFHEELALWVRRYMKLLTPEAITKALDSGFRILISQVVDNVMEEMRIKAGVAPRKAKSRQRPALNVARKLASSLGGNPTTWPSARKQIKIPSIHL
jgi:hypothetical protein